MTGLDALNEIKKINMFAIRRSITGVVKTQEELDSKIDQLKLNNIVLSLSDDELLAYIDISIRDIAQQIIPIKLVETNGSSSVVLRRLNKDYFMRMPKKSSSDKKLDIDSSLHYCVVINALTKIDSTFFSSYEADVSLILTNQASDINDILYVLEKPVDNNVVLFRFSANDEDWHDTPEDDDLYIKFYYDSKWSDSKKFVGDKGDKGEDGKDADISEHDISELKNVPDLVADKWLKINSDGDAIELADEPSGGGGGNPDFDEMTLSEDTSGTITLSLKYDDDDVKACHQIVMDDDTDLDISKTDDVYDMEVGRIYTIMFYNGDDYVPKCVFDSWNDIVLSSDYEWNIIQIMFDGEDIHCLNIFQY